jgi:serine phosphatase RsbU (regulator of sigma subunit)
VPSTALIVADRSTASDELSDVLAGDGYDVHHRELDTVHTAGPVPCPDLLLVDVSASPHRLAELVDSFVGLGGVGSVVVFAGEDPAAASRALERHAGAGTDFLLPPYLPALVKARLSACGQRIELAETMRRIQLAEHLLKYERELQIGREIQQGFLPASLPDPAGWQLDVRYSPAREVAGDFYDAYDLDGGLVAFVVADVCDKGVGAALFMALMRTLLRHTALQTDALARVSAPPPDLPAATVLDDVQPVGAFTAPLVNSVVGTNDYMTDNHLAQGYFATMFCGLLDPATGELSYINGGHYPPVLLDPAGGTRLLHPTGPAVGLLPGGTFTLRTATLAPGDTLFVYTDGVPEAKDATGAFYGDPRMFAEVAAAAADPRQLLPRMETSLLAFRGEADQFDDITMMSLHRVGPDTPSSPEELTP